MANSNAGNPRVHCLNESKEEANIVSVEFLDGGINKTLTSDGLQFVNLPADIKYRDGTVVKNTDRLSRTPGIKVEFDRPGYHAVWIKFELVPNPLNDAYTPDEKKRYIRATYTKHERLFILNFPDKKAFPSINVAVSGNDEYKISAKDIHGKIVTSSFKIKTMRLLYYVEIKMKNLPAPASMPINLNTLENEFAKHYFKMINLGFVEIEHIENLDTGKSKQKGDFIKTVGDAFNGSNGVSKRPYCVAIAYTDHQAEKYGLRRRKWCTVGALKETIDMMIGSDSYGLWKNVVAAEDWYKSCFFFKKRTPLQIKQGKKPIPINIVKAKCTPMPAVGNPNSYKSVEIDLSSIPIGTQGTIELKVNIVKSWTLGESFWGTNIVCIATRCEWNKVSDQDQNQIAIHEMGHHVGMVADGTGISPAKVATYYISKALAPTHYGPHCHCGIPPIALTPGHGYYDSYTNYLLSDCVMYGSIKSGKTAFCANCTPAMRKLDISNGFR